MRGKVYRGWVAVADVGGEGVRGLHLAAPPWGNEAAATDVVGVGVQLAGTSRNPIYYYV